MFRSAPTAAAATPRPTLRSIAITFAAIAAASIVVVVPTGAATAALDDTPWVLPVPPERCTAEQAESGDVADCIVAFYDDPATTGWGVPPAPGVGEGWSWNGYRYNGSPALADWEATYIAANTDPVADLRAGALETHADAQPLFEGFLDEITALGYRVRDASGYSFRCTAGAGGWDCPSGDPDDLSNHAWGLAIDMNSSTNPIRSYSGDDGETACRTPIVTDIPRWMIQTAEKWGLYWGGYGWNSGCQSLDTQRTIVSRDPPHFEFRGTPEQAAAIAAFNTGNDPNAICRIVVDDDGDEVEQCTRSTRPQADTRLAVDLAAPDGAVAALVNLTATDGVGPGYLTLEDCGPRSGERATSALTFTAGESVASMAIVPLTDGGRFCVYRSTAVHSIVDVSAYLVPATPADPDDEAETGSSESGDAAGDGPLWFEPVTPARLTDSREDGACVPQQECRPGSVPAGAAHSVPTDSGDARVVNLTVVDAASPGYAQVGRCTDVGLERTFSNINVMDAGARANLALVPEIADGMCAFTLSDANLIVDELGRLTAGNGFGWSLGPARRAIDTRECETAWCEGRPDARTVFRVDLDTDAPAAAIAITVTDTAAAGYVTVGRCDDLEHGGGERTSNVNHAAGATTTGLALVALDAGQMCVFTRSPAHVIIDVQAELTVEQAVGMMPTTPERSHDSRS